MFSGAHLKKKCLPQDYSAFTPPAVNNVPSIVLNYTSLVFKKNAPQPKQKTKLPKPPKTHINISNPSTLAMRKLIRFIFSSLFYPHSVSFI